MIHRLSASRLIALGIISCLATASAADRPNIVLVMADDMGWSDLGCYGGEIPTPNIDSLAKRGMRFTQFYNNAVCGPTRASLLTGLYPQQIGHSGRHWNQPKDFTKCATIAELLQPHGYHTMMVGKWQGRDLAVKRGFNRFFGPNCRAKISYYHEVQQNEFYLDDQRWRLPNDFFMTDAFNDHAVEFLDESLEQEKPFFLYLAYIAPHWPLHAPEKYVAPHRERYRSVGWDEWRHRRFARQREMKLLPESAKLSPRIASVHDWKTDPDKEWQAERMAVYAAQISRIDDGVGRLLKTLREHDADQNTVFLFLSDNGAAPDGGTRPAVSGFGFSPKGKNDQWRLDKVAIRPGSGPKNMPGPHDTFSGYGIAWANVSNTPLRSTKMTAYEGGIRTPLIVQWPAVIKTGGALTLEVGHVMDLMPTCLELAGTTYPEKLATRKLLPLEGHSLVPIFHGSNRPGYDQIYWSVPRSQAVRAGNWKLANSAPGKPWELFDLATDPGETTDLSARHPARVTELSDRFAKWQSRVGDRN